MEQVKGNFSCLIAEFETPVEKEEELEANTEVANTGKFSWTNLVNCSLKWTPQTPQGESAFE